MVRITNNIEKRLASYEQADRKHSGRWARQQASRSHSRRKRRRGGR